MPLGIKTVVTNRVGFFFFPKSDIQVLAEESTNSRRLLLTTLCHLEAKVSLCPSGSQKLPGEETARCAADATSSQVCRHRLCGTPAPPPPLCLVASAAPRRPRPGLRPLAGVIPEISAASRTLKLNGAHKAETMFSERVGDRGATRPEEGVCSSIMPSSRWATGHRHLYCTCICSKVQRVWPGARRGRPLRAGAQIQQKSPPPRKETKKEGEEG